MPRSPARGQRDKHDPVFSYAVGDTDGYLLRVAPLGAAGHHLQVLLDAGAVLCRRAGREVLYWRLGTYEIGACKVCTRRSAPWKLAPAHRPVRQVGLSHRGARERS